ncbi:unnamed protein product [Parascedosporium putredinis]|uniref:Rhodopsin domain-containing protein n=1 Tax=Parascedosporium putredinis TaxID=1442378 RepID=A0A9P1MA05_9PEZI|nr:unnamed protein product [Parascedosporium putredinis]CAI7993096.1 unnamed protein product [Parascedosporium putredinis]
MDEVHAAPVELRPSPVDPATVPHNSLKGSIIACAVVCWVIAVAFVGLRFYTRTRVVRVLSLPDWLILGGVFVSALQSAAFIAEAQYGLGSHVWDFDLASTYIPLQMSAWMAILAYNISLLFVKASFLTLYLRIFSYQKAQIACKIILGLVVFSGLWTVVISATACIPSRPFGTCPLHVSTDFLIWLVPLPQIWGMKMPKAQKITLIVLFSFGFLVAFISIIRVIFLVDLHKTADPDFSWAGAKFGYLSLIELNAAIVAACLVTLKPLAHKLWPTIFESEDSVEVAGPNPPTIGTQGAALHNRSHSIEVTGKEELQTWEMSKTDVEKSSTGSTVS